MLEALKNMASTAVSLMTYFFQLTGLDEGGLISKIATEEPFVRRKGLDPRHKSICCSDCLWKNSATGRFVLTKDSGNPKMIRCYF